MKNLFERLKNTKEKKMNIDIDAIIAKHEQARDGMQKRANEADQEVKAEKQKQIDEQRAHEKSKGDSAIIKAVKSDREPMYIIEYTEHMKDLEKQAAYYHSEVQRLDKKLQVLREIKLSGEYDRIIPSK